MEPAKVLEKLGFSPNEIKSTNRCFNWTQTAKFNNQTLSVSYLKYFTDTNGNGYLLAATNIGLWISNNDGDSWQTIQSYTDQSDNDNFKFEAFIPKKILDNLTNDDLLSRFKLIKKVTENYTVIDENNKIKVFNSSREILDYFITIKLSFLSKRKNNQLQNIKADIEINKNKIAFIDAIITGKLVVSNRKKADVEDDLDKMINIDKYNNSYDYLLNMNIMSLTTERLAKLKSDLANLKQSFKDITAITETDMWLEFFK